MYVPTPAVGDSQITFVEGREARVAGGLMVVASAAVAGMVAATAVLLAILSATEWFYGSHDSAAPAAVASVAVPTAAGAAGGAGDVGSAAVAPEVAPALPASGAATRSPRVEDGPPEGAAGEHAQGR